MVASRYARWVLLVAMAWASLPCRADVSADEAARWAPVVARAARRVEAGLVSELPAPAALPDTPVVYRVDDQYGIRLGESAQLFVGPGPDGDSPFAPPQAAEGAWVLSAPHRIAGCSLGRAEAVPITLGAPLLRDVAGDSEGAVAFAIGHELAHLALGHLASVPGPASGPTDPVERASAREREYEADRVSVRAGIAAGYSLSDLLSFARGALRFPDLDVPACSLGTFSDHPTWAERLARLDAPNQGYWRASSLFRAGTVYMAWGDYESAFAQFDAAARDLPDEAEVQVNAGAAALLSSYDLMDAAALDDFTGRGGVLPMPAWFLRLPDNLRGADEAARLRWLDEARARFTKAAELDPSLAEARLGQIICDLVSHGADAAAAEAQLRETWEAQRPPDPVSAARIVSCGLVAARLAQLPRHYWVEAARGLGGAVVELPPEFAYDVAVSLGGEGSAEDKAWRVRLVSAALARLGTGSPYRDPLVSLWRSEWPSAPVPAARPARWRRAGEARFRIGDAERVVRVPCAEAELEADVGCSAECIPASGDICRLVFREPRLTAYSSSDGVFLAALSDPTARVPLVSATVGEASAEIAVGMSRAAVRSLLGDSTAPMSVTDGGYFLYYREPSIALRYTGTSDSDTVAEIALIPR